MVVPDNLTHIEGPNLLLRLVRLEDAEYIHGLRKDPAYNQHLSEVTGNADDQRKWIEGYKTRESSGQEYYYVIERKDGVRCGVVRLYDIKADHFTWGSWILDHNKTPKAALESAVLSFSIGFDVLHLPQALVDVRIDNERAISIYQRMGMTELRRDDESIYFTYSRSRFNVDRAGYLEIVKGEQTA